MGISSEIGATLIVLQTMTKSLFLRDYVLMLSVIMSLPLKFCNIFAAVQSLNKVGTAYFFSLFFSKFKNITFSK